MKINSYAVQHVKLVRNTHKPAELIKAACEMCTAKKIKNVEASIKFLIEAEHTSLLEHVSFTFHIGNISRALLAQLTRHRIASYTMASQHYQIYTKYDHVVHEDLVDSVTLRSAIQVAEDAYLRLIEADYPREEARMVLPNSKCVNGLWTINARSLLNFLRIRLCERNVQEMVLFAHNVKEECMKWCPEIFKHAVPDCESELGCRQGRMACVAKGGE